jgi:hypothetical protein
VAAIRAPGPVRERLVATFMRLVQVDLPSRERVLWPGCCWPSYNDSGGRPEMTAVAPTAATSSPSWPATTPSNRCCSPRIWMWTCRAWASGRDSRRVSSARPAKPSWAPTPRRVSPPWWRCRGARRAWRRAGRAAARAGLHLGRGDRPPRRQGARHLPPARPSSLRPGRPDTVGTIVIAAPTYYAFSIRVIGRAAHAGVEPERGVSAITVTAEALKQLPVG